MKRSTITVTIVVDHDASEDAVQVLEDVLHKDREGVIHEVIEPHVDHVEDLKEE
jgi:predicted DNA-binding protein